jgi:hypothetical protein
MPVCISVRPNACQRVCLPDCLAASLFIHMSVCLFIHPSHSVCLSVVTRWDIFLQKIGRAVGEGKIIKERIKERVATFNLKDLFQFKIYGPNKEQETSTF